MPDHFTLTALRQIERRISHFKKWIILFEFDMKLRLRSETFKARLMRGLKTVLLQKNENLRKIASSISLSILLSISFLAHYCQMSFNLTACKFFYGSTEPWHDDGGESQKWNCRIWGELCGHWRCFVMWKTPDFFRFQLTRRLWIAKSNVNFLDWPFSLLLYPLFRCSSIDRKVFKQLCLNNARILNVIPISPRKSRSLLARIRNYIEKRKKNQHEE